jgi:hypothetical protein
VLAVVRIDRGLLHLQILEGEIAVAAAREKRDERSDDDRYD